MALKSSFGGEKQESSHHAPSLTPQSNHSCFDTTVFLPTYPLIALELTGFLGLSVLDITTFLL